MFTTDQPQVPLVNGTDHKHRHSNPNLIHEHPRRKIVVHFDIRNTMIVADTVTNITVEQALNAYLTGVLWGKEGSDGDWVWLCDEPTLKKPHQEAETFYRHLEKQIVRSPPDRTKLRLAVGDFVQTEVGKKFEEHVDKHLALLEWTYGEKRHHLSTLVGKSGKEYHYVLPAVYRLVEYLSAENRDFSINIRTYGLDCTSVLASMKHFISETSHPQFPDLPNMHINTTAGNIKRGDNDRITLQENKADGESIVLTSDDDIYQHFSQSQGITGYKDDFHFWDSENYHHQSSKPLWIDPNDPDHLHILFDDNYRPGNMDSIANVRERQKDKSWLSLPLEKVDEYENISLVQVDLLAAIADVNYYVHKVKECEANYAQLLSLRK